MTPLSPISIREMNDIDWPQVREIYQQGIETGNATVETIPPSWEVWNNSHHRESRLIAFNEWGIVGWGCLGIFSVRPAYKGVGEVSIYIAVDYRGKGIGKLLLQNLITSSEEKGFWTLTAKIFSDNITSIQLHLNNGFREVGVNKRLGKLNGRWRDVVLLERRSEKVGLD